MIQPFQSNTRERSPLCWGIATWLLAGLLALGYAPDALAQTDMELAEYYFNEGSYPQAKLYLEGIWKKNKTNAVYKMYYATLLAWMISTPQKTSSSPG